MSSLATPDPFYACLPPNNNLEPRIIFIIDGHPYALIDGIARGSYTVFFMDIYGSALYYYGEDPKLSSDDMIFYGSDALGASELIAKQFEYTQLLFIGPLLNYDLECY